MNAPLHNVIHVASTQEKWRATLAWRRRYSRAQWGQVYRAARRQQKKDIEAIS